MKVLFLHFPSEARDAKAARLAKTGVQLIVEEPRWPHFYEVAKRERPAAVVIDFSKAPAHAQETADYLSKAKYTRDLELFAIHVFDERRDLLRERVPKIQTLSERELSAVIVERLPKWEADRAAAEQAAREERQQRAEEKKAAAAASRARARERRMAEQQAAGPAPAVTKETVTAPRARKPAPAPVSKAKKAPARRSPARRPKPKPRPRPKKAGVRKPLARPKPAARKRAPSAVGKKKRR
jgi:pyruvate/2-oxoglutarate dehydrogenase complex dihydrolipoamide acyltransferase (E2) component